MNESNLHSKRYTKLDLQRKYYIHRLIKKIQRFESAVRHTWFRKSFIAFKNLATQIHTNKISGKRAGIEPKIPLRKPRWYFTLPYKINYQTKSEGISTRRIIKIFILKSCFCTSWESFLEGEKFVKNYL